MQSSYTWSWRTCQCQFIPEDKSNLVQPNLLKDPERAGAYYRVWGTLRTWVITAVLRPACLGGDRLCQRRSILLATRPCWPHPVLLDGHQVLLVGSHPKQKTAREGRVRDLGSNMMPISPLRCHHKTRSWSSKASGSNRIAETCTQIAAMVFFSTRIGPLRDGKRQRSVEVHHGGPRVKE